MITWGFISRNYVVWPTFFLMNVFIALKGSHFWFLYSLSSIARAVPRHWAHLNSGSGRKGPLMPLHFLCTQRLQSPQKIALELPTPDWQTPQGYFPDFFSTSRLMPDSIIFVFPMFTHRPFFSISVFMSAPLPAVPPQTQHWSSGRLPTAAPTDTLCGTPWIEPLTQWWRVAG